MPTMPVPHPMQPQRHSLVWLTAPGWQQVQAQTSTEPVAAREALARWRAADWPLVVRRHLPTMPATDVALGIALPPQPVTGVKPRIAVTVERARMRQVDLPLSLATALPAAPLHWRAALLALHLESLHELPGLHVFGSLAWQAITGMSYLRTTSDIDLLVAPATRSELEACLACLRRHAMTLPLDGEILFPCGAAVAWKEWDDVMRPGVAGPRRVLSKHADRVTLCDCSMLLASFDAPGAPP